MNCLHISLFGKFCVVSQTKTWLEIEPAKVQELFFFLLLYANRPHTREKLAELLWQDSTAVQSRKYLRQTLWQLNGILDNALGNHELLLVDSDWIQINPNVEYWLDTEEFKIAYAQSQGVAGSALTPTDALKLMEAVTLYQGDLLENFYQDWCLFERERLQNLYLTILHKLMVFCEFSQQYEAGILYGMKMLQCDQAREQTHRRLMRMRFLAGDRTGALRQFDRCVAFLRQELNVDPAQRTLDLVQQIRQGVLTENHSSPVQPQQTAVAASSDDLLTHLHNLKQTLRQTQHQIDQNISFLNKHDPSDTRKDQPL